MKSQIYENFIQRKKKKFKKKRNLIKKNKTYIQKFDAKSDLFKIIFSNLLVKVHENMDILE